MISQKEKAKMRKIRSLLSLITLSTFSRKIQKITPLLRQINIPHNASMNSF